jgi:hypothetical protein
MDLILAFSLQDQVEKYGAYVGLAAFIGLAVLTVLYFAQARELKRLRDWAGRAPERAAELQARVVAQAEESLRAPEVEPAVERSGTVGPAQPVAQPAAGNGRQAGTPAPIPMGPRPAVAMAAAAARAESANASAKSANASAKSAKADSGEESAGADSSDAEAASVVESSDAEAPPVVDSSNAEAAPVEEEPATSGNGVPAKPPADAPETTIPRATPRPQPKPQPRPVPAAAPLRASTTRTATPPRRTTRRSQRGDSSRTGLYTLIGIVVLAIAIFVPVYFMVLSGDETTPPPNPIAEPGGTPASDAGAGEGAAAARPDKVVVVLNGTSIEGLAGRERDTLIQAGYADGMIRIDNSDDQSRQDSLVLYAADERRQARDVSRLLDITRTEEIDEETQALADSSDDTGTLPADVVVVLGTDKAP